MGKRSSFLVHSSRSAGGVVLTNLQRKPACGTKQTQVSKLANLEDRDKLGALIEQLIR
jgi:hypothetical protein